MTNHIIRLSPRTYGKLHALELDGKKVKEIKRNHNGYELVAIFEDGTEVPILTPKDCKKDLKGRHKDCLHKL